MKHLSLFSGMGGFDLAAQWMGWENIAHCEINPVLRKVLNYYWPNAISYDDIKKTDFTIHRGQVDIVTGGFPCQPYSQAGKRLGKEDERHLWPEMLRAIREIQPAWIVGENVRGLTNWNGGMVFDEVQSDLEAEGYEVLPFLLPAAGVNAPHERYRIWFVAYAGCSGISINESGIVSNGDGNDQSKIQGQSIKQSGVGTTGKERNASDAKNTGQQTRVVGHGKEQSWRGDEPMGAGKWDRFPTQSPVCDGDDGIPTKLDGITISKHRIESIKAAGNAVVPQVVYEIFKAINNFNPETK